MTTAQTSLELDYVDLSTLVKILFSKKWFILSMSVLVFIATMLFAIIKPPEYQVSTLLLIQQDPLHGRNGAIYNDSAIGSIRRPIEPITAQIALLRSNFILNPVAHDLKMDIKYPKSEVTENIRKKLSIINLNGDPQNSTESALLQVSLIGKDPYLVTQVLNQIAYIAKIKNEELKKKQAEAMATFLNHQLLIVKKSLQDSENKLNRYRTLSGKIDIKLQIQQLMEHIADIDKQIEEVSLKKTNLLQIYTQEHPYVIELEKKSNELRKRKLTLFNQLKELPSEDQVAVTLAREVNVKNNLYIHLLQEIHALESEKKGIVSDIQILSPATIPEISLPVRLTIIGIASAIIGLILGCIIVLAWKTFIRRVDQPYWIEKTCGVKNLAIIPYSKKQYVNTCKVDPHKRLPLLAYQAPGDISLEALCSLRTFLQLNLKKVDNNIIGIMGLTKNIGKSFVSANLAYLFSRIGSKILLIDADVRHGHIHQYFSNARTPGLTDVINNKCSVENALVHLAHFGNLFFLPAGELCEDTSDILISEKFKSLLSICKNSYDYIIINGSSKTSHSDNILLGNQTGINLLLIGANLHSPHEIASAIDDFTYAGIRWHGAIYNHHISNKKLKF